MKSYDEAIKIMRLKINELSLKSIRKSYGILVHATHPDKTMGDDTEFKKIGAAYEALYNIYNENILKTLEENAFNNMASALSNSSNAVRNLLLNTINTLAPKQYKKISGEVEYYMAQHLSYAPSSTTTSRIYAYQTKAEGNIKDSYKQLRGDVLKTEILVDFKESLQGVSLTELPQVIATFKQSDEYKILQKSQGITTSFFNLKTDSVKAFEALCEEARSGAYTTTREKSEKAEVEQVCKPAGLIM